MEEHNEDTASVMNSIVKNEEDGRELTATPLKRYVTVFGDRKDACKWVCNFGCKLEPYTGTYSRIRAHLIGLLPGQKSQGVALCSKVTKEDREKMRREEDEAKRVFGSCARRAPISSIPVAPPINRVTSSISTDKGTNDITDMYRVSSKDEVDGAIARFFYGNGIPFNVAKSPFWFDMVRAINEAPKRYEPPTSEKVKTTLLDREKTKVDQALISIKQQWPTYGVSIVSDGWADIKKETLIKVMAVSEGRAMLISGINCSKDDFSSEFVAESLLKAIESVGAYSLVQVLTDDISTCKAAGKIIETAYPHIFWSGCMAHTLSLLLKDIFRSRHPSLASVTRCYNQAKGIMKYIKNHSSSLYIFRTFSALDVLQVKSRRYGQSFVMLHRIYRVKNALINMVLSDEWEKLKKGKSISNMDHEEVRKTLLDDDFWKTLKFILTFTNPIWDVIHFCDLDKACIGEVYQKMDDMLGFINSALSNNADLSQVVRNLVVGRWQKNDLPLHTLAYVLTPYYYSESWLTTVSPGGEKRKKPHADPDVHKVYLDAVDRLVRDFKEASIVRQQLSDFISNSGSFERSQAIKDRETMPALSWWHLYGASAPELYSLAVKVLSQSVNITCSGRSLINYDYIHNVQKNKINAGRAESLVYVHYNHRLLTRCREDYEGLYKNWDDLINDDNLEIDMEAIEEREYAILNEFPEAHPIQVSHETPILSSQTSTRGSSNSQVDEIALGKRSRLV